LQARGLDCVRPRDAACDETARLIMEELVHGVVRPETVARLQKTVAGLPACGCDAVVLGCTEIPLIIDDTNSPLPSLGSSRLRDGKPRCPHAAHFVHHAACGRSILPLRAAWFERSVARFGPHEDEDRWD
jgi:hypothetical protein